MEIKEASAARVVIAKPVASKPSCSMFRSFSELLAGAINVSPPPRACSETAVAAIRPKTVRVNKPAVSHASALPSSQSQAEVPRALAPAQSQDTLAAADTKSTVVYKPLAKLVSKSTVPLLAKVGNFSTSLKQAVPPVNILPQHPHRPQGQYLRSHQRSQNPTTSQAAETSSRVFEASRTPTASQTVDEGQNAVIPAVANVDRPSYDGYNWRKYGQKQVKGSEYPRSYYKCTHPNCPVKKKVERTLDGQIAEIVYKGEHNHVKPQPPKKNTPAVTTQTTTESEGTAQDFSINIDSNINVDKRSSQYVNDPRNEVSVTRTTENQNETTARVSALPAYRASSNSHILPYHPSANAGHLTPDNSCGVSGDYDNGSKGIDTDEEEPKSKRRKSEVQASEAGPSGDGMQVPKIVVQSTTDTDIVGDGFRWRKYGQKVVKGNPYPRSYYRCTSLKCNMRKHVERASEDPKSFITTYEGKHNHEMPARSPTQAASEQESQSQASKDRK